MLKWNGEEIKKKLQAEVEMRLEILGVDAVSAANNLCPYDKGRLRGSITYATKNKASSVSGSAKSGDEVEKPSKNGVVRIGTNVEYAAIQEFGGEIRAKNAPYLTFKIDGHWVRVKQVKIGGKFYLKGGMQQTEKVVKQIMSFNL